MHLLSTPVYTPWEPGGSIEGRGGRSGPAQARTRQAMEHEGTPSISHSQEPQELHCQSPRESP